MSNDPCAQPHDEALLRWEVNPKTKVYTRRCVRCGSVTDSTKTDPNALTSTQK